MNPRWPLHPPPYEYDVLDRWVERLAAEYGVSKPVFCRHALGLTHQEIGLLRSNPPEEVLSKLETGTGVPLQRLQDMTTIKVFQRMTRALEQFMQEDPEGFALLEWSFRNWGRSAPDPQGPAEDIDRESRG
jgi:TniQ